MLVKFATSIAAFVMAGATVGGAALVVNGDVGAEADTQLELNADPQAELEGSIGVITDLGSRITGTASLVSEAVVESSSSVDSSVEVSVDMSTDADADVGLNDSVEGSGEASTEGSLILEITP